VRFVEPTHGDNVLAALLLRLHEIYLLNALGLWRDPSSETLHFHENDWRSPNAHHQPANRPAGRRRNRTYSGVAQRDSK
jgi:hypothetical protein